MFWVCSFGSFCVSMLRVVLCGWLMSNVEFCLWVRVMLVCSCVEIVFGVVLLLRNILCEMFVRLICCVLLVVMVVVLVWLLIRYRL